MDETRKWLAMGIGYGVGVALGLTLGTAGSQLARQAIERRELARRPEPRGWLPTTGATRVELGPEGYTVVEPLPEPVDEPEPEAGDE